MATIPLKASLLYKAYYKVKFNLLYRDRVGKLLSRYLKLNVFQVYSKQRMPSWGEEGVGEDLIEKNFFMEFIFINTFFKHQIGSTP